MISVYHLSDAVPAAMFGMFALWAAASRRHWFVRTTVVGGALLVALLIPAYEVVIQFGIASLVVVAGLAIWRRRRRPVESPATDRTSTSRFRPRLSVATMLLAVVIIAVITAVVARSPSIAADQWNVLAVTGVMAAAVCLSCVWIVCGRAPWQVRVLAWPLLAIVLGVTIHILMWAGWLVQAWFRGSPPLSQYWQTAVADAWSGATYWVTAVGVGMAILCAWLFLMRRADWFDPFNEPIAEPAPTDRAWRRIVLARWAAALFFMIVSLFPLALLYRLMTPTPIPAVKLPEPNGFDDFVAAGCMFSPAEAATLSSWNQLTDTELRRLLARHDAAFDRVRQGLQKDCWDPYGYVFLTTEDEAALIPLMNAMFARAVLAERAGSANERFGAYWDFLRVTVEADRGAGDTYSIPAQTEQHAISGLWNCRTRLTAKQCVELAAKLWKLESSRESWQTKAERQRIIDENVNWQWRLQAILAEWSHTERYEWARQLQLIRMTQVRILIVELGIRAHQLETGRVPATLADLVPHYLTAIPDDPYADGAIKYGVKGNDYTLSSAGPDGDDDGGRPPSNLISVMNGQTDDGDLTDAVLFPATLQKQVSTSTAEDTSPSDAATEASAEESPMDP